LYLQPGVNHCWGGDGPDVFDAVSALDNWMRSGRAPARITAMHMSDTGVDRTRPLCPYPQVAKYVGSGSINQAENFRCAADVGTPMPPPAPGRRAATR
jgi:feruloyl esterase